MVKRLADMSFELGLMSGELSWMCVAEHYLSPDVGEDLKAADEIIRLYSVVLLKVSRKIVQDLRKEACLSG